MTGNRGLGYGNVHIGGGSEELTIVRIARTQRMNDLDTSHPFAYSRGSKASKASKGSRASKGSKDSRDSRASLISGRSGLRVRDASDGTARRSSAKLGGGGGDGGGGGGDGERPISQGGQSAVSESDFSIDQDNGPDAERSAISLLLGGESPFLFSRAVPSRNKQQLFPLPALARSQRQPPSQFLT